MKKMIVSGWEEERKKQRKKKEEEEERDDNFKIRAKTRRQKKIMTMKNMVQIHDEQRSIQMTILHIYIYIYKTLLRQAL